MRARLVVFPVKGRNWCVSRSVDPLLSETSSSSSSNTPSSLKQLWHNFSSSNQHKSNNVELIVDFISHKMNMAWIGLGKAPYGSLKNKIHGLGLKLLAREKPSEIFRKSISKEVSRLNLNAQLVCQRLRHIALRFCFCLTSHSFGSYIALTLVSSPVTSLLQGSEKLLQLVSDYSQTQNFDLSDVKGSEAEHKNFEHETSALLGSPWVLLPSGELEKLVSLRDKDDGLSKCAISDICAIFKLNTIHVSKYEDGL